MVLPVFATSQSPRALSPSAKVVPKQVVHLLGFFSVWPCHMACGILVPQPGIEPRSSAIRVQSPNHTTHLENVQDGSTGSSSPPPLVISGNSLKFSSDTALYLGIANI